ncbi:MAG: N-formylglutamate amidohydrolase [Coriobacteriia bacterium]|nr:N-formylglutamate amidohydrolase [Coriobacteriia bacterium]MBN2839387.1 N-formylglutamate amidohydrolase [Coriobacteriia bacterium]
MTSDAVDAPWSVVRGRGPIIALALHAGHEIRPEVATLVKASEADRLREEDPGTERFGAAVPTRVAVNRSRFEVDLNRPRERAVYGDVTDTWGIDVWNALPLPEGVFERSLAMYDAFYAEFEHLLDDVVMRHGGFVVLDLHSYNHRRGGQTAEPDDPTENPGVNLGTGSLDRERWSPVVDAFAESLADALGPGADVRENVKFRGGHLSRWVHDHYPTGCCLAIEFKKTYMDEWTGVIDATAAEQISNAVARTLPHLQAALRRVVHSGTDC